MLNIWWRLNYLLFSIYSYSVGRSLANLEHRLVVLISCHICIIFFFLLMTYSEIFLKLARCNYSYVLCLYLCKPSVWFLILIYKNYKSVTSYWYMSASIKKVFIWQNNIQYNIHVQFHSFHTCNDYQTWLTSLIFDGSTCTIV